MFFKKDVLLSRLQSEVDYLRDQNKALMDRLLLLTDKPAYREQKASEWQERAQAVELERVKGMSPVEIEISEKKKTEENRIKNIMLNQMMTGAAS